MHREFIGESGEDGEILKYGLIYDCEYDKKGRLSFERWEDPESGYFEETSYTYNSKGFLTMMYANDSGAVTVYEYKYNKAVIVPGDINYSTTPDDWFESYFKFEEMTDKTKQDLCRQIHSNVSVDKVYIKIIYRDRIAAVASLAIEDGYSLLHNVVVDPALRGMGLGKKLCWAAISKSKAKEADYSYLQVIETNEVALNLYKKFGYEKLYTYWYMVKK